MDPLESCKFMQMKSAKIVNLCAHQKRDQGVNSESSSIDTQQKVLVPKDKAHKQILPVAVPYVSNNFMCGSMRRQVIDAQ